ncbi:uncharacterized protein LOC111716832 [Eurytemora carolleeae]|uniref:uncharacterized protein LOC111716832 n=1 Tax=Eurytemora carolleeae TaxID=1294199 RepID=UPI000C762E43|nr:uncharacterized protein LOC111716832 [Eurytemora carolleeae]|eukprot:XP_023348094.1 uncharacterized protein LOC111716832 [Eurytemora affinis]
MIHIWITILILPSISCNYTLVNGLLLAGKTNQSSISSDLEISSNSSETSSIEEHGNDYMVGGNEDEEYDDYENENEEDVETNNLDISPKFAGKGEQQMAFIFKQGECSSSLIHRDWLLTAAHCLGSDSTCI